LLKKEIQKKIDNGIKIERERGESVCEISMMERVMTSPQPGFVFHALATLTFALKKNKKILTCVLYKKLYFHQ